MNPTNPKVDAFLSRATSWQAEFTKLREIALASPLVEGFKWGQPCYSYDGKNILIIHGFKEYCAMLFVNGALLKDPGRILIQQTTNVQAARQIRFTNLDEIVELEPVLKEYIKEAIEVEKAGLKVELKKPEEYPVPAEFQSQLSANPALQTAFTALTPGRQRAYLLFFAAPKQSQTRSARVEKYIPQILVGKGLND
jgi:uncharacterized protein YdeI (YjbR/CyaY-like superfamily)